MQNKLPEKNEEIENARKVVLERMREVSEKQFSIIEDYILNGYKETLSNLLLYIGKERASAVLEKLPSDLSEELSALLEKSEREKTDGKKDPHVMTDAGHVLRMSGYYGEQTFDDIFENLEPQARFMLGNITDDFMDENPILSLNVEIFNFDFEDIVVLDDRAIQRVLRECAVDELAKALKVASSDVQEKIFRNMSKRASNMLKEDMEFMGPVRFYDAQTAQMRIVNIIKRLEKNGEIVIARQSSDVVLR